ncbi:uncharacterized protein LOC109845834 [Asparagus officinalis]|uniref:uncharacterized protein LOC109845834 n=1 Tax=Asparagus officinalis TaxID=4686 RepID=UPI00098E2115|nr:uncharacterized protein LOC109845834 [Asparagus officinalis]
MQHQNHPPTQVLLGPRHIHHIHSILTCGQRPRTFSVYLYLRTLISPRLIQGSTTHVLREGAKKDRIEGRRGGGKPDSKQPPRGMRGIIRWNSSNLPVGPWSTRLNAYIGVLVRRATIVNPYFYFQELYHGPHTRRYGLRLW